MLMDEAFSALDPADPNGYAEPIDRTQASCKRRIVFITHDPRRSLSSWRHLVILTDGFCRRSKASPAIILLNAVRPVHRRFVSDINRARVPACPVACVRPRNTPATLAAKLITRHLESLIEKSGGDTTTAYRVMKDGQQVGTWNGRSGTFLVRKGVI